MTDADRAALIDLLERLGSGDDATVLEAARALHRKVTESGWSWDDLSRLDTSDSAPASEEGETERAEAAVVLGPDAADTFRLIDRMLRKGVSESLREDLNEMKQQLADGSLDEDDRRYVRALAKRLGV